MREEILADFVMKEDTYLKIAARYIAVYNVPPKLLYGIDETNALFF